MARTPREPLAQVHFLATLKMLEELKIEERRTGLSRTTLLKIAWQQYMARTPADRDK